MSASSVLFAALVLFGSAANGSKKFVQRLPNGGNIEGYRAIGHADGTGKKKATNDFGDAFHKAGNKWTVELCQADTDGDGQTNGQELGDPCCEWIVGYIPRWTSGASHPGLKDKTSNPTLWKNINCSEVTTTISTTTSATSGTDSLLMVRSVAFMLALAAVIGLMFA